VAFLRRLRGTSCSFLEESVFPRALGGGLAASLALLPLAASSQPPDTTPPTPGTVWDGAGIDLDEQEDTHTLQGDWSQPPGFSDPESGIVGYSIIVGTRPCSKDVLGYKNVGLDRSRPLFNLNLIPGQRYYITVRALNGAGLATHVSSNGVLILPRDGAPAPFNGGPCTPDGAPPDAGTDGGAPDTPPDAGTPPDGGTPPRDAGTPDDGGALEAPLGWGCTTGGPGGVAMMALSVLGLVLRLRSVRTR
jgi:hypothetical protein